MTFPFNPQWQVHELQWEVDYWKKKWIQTYAELVWWRAKPENRWRWLPWLGTRSEDGYRTKTAADE